MREFHSALARRAIDDPEFHGHYATARAMYNLARAAEAGWQGSVAETRDFELVWEGRPIGAGQGRVNRESRNVHSSIVSRGDGRCE